MATTNSGGTHSHQVIGKNTNAAGVHVHTFTGVPGPAGPAGPQGATGPQGPAGPVDPTLAARVTALEARVAALEAAEPPPPPQAALPPDTTLRYVAGTATPRPGYLAEITDPTWGTKVRRISNVHGRRNYNVTQVSFSRDGDRLIFFPSGGLRVIRTSDWADLGQMNAGGADRCQWSNLTNKLLYGTQDAAGQVRTTTGEVGVGWTAYATFPGWGYVSMNYGMLSRDDRVALLCTVNADRTGAARVYLYDLPNRVIVGYVDPGFTPSSAHISIDGRYVIVDRPSNGAQYAYSIPGANVPCAPMAGGAYGAGGQVRANGSHWVMAELADGTPVSVSLANGGEIRRLADNALTPLFPIGHTAFNWGAGGHLSYANRDRPGWVIASSGVNNGEPGTDQVVAVKLDGSGTVKVFAEAHCCRVVTPASELATPFAIANRDMTTVVWGSAWDGSQSTEVFCFVAGMAT